MEAVYFWFFALLALLCGGGLLSARHPITGAVNLIGVMLSLAGIYGLLDAPFMGTVQILVYAGAIMMLIIFVIMVLNAAADHQVPKTGPLRLALGLGAAGCLLAILAPVLAATQFGAASEAPEIKRIGAVMFATGEASHGWYLLFEFTGLLLLAAMVAGIQLAKRSLASVESPAEQGEGH
jgi:NADH-quinone oxidoreductase subunit J